MGRLLEPVSNGRARLMIEPDRTRLTALLLNLTPFPESEGVIFLFESVCFSIQFHNLARYHSTELIKTWLKS